MSKPIGEVINNLALKAGVKPDDEKLKSLLASPELLNIKVEDELITAIDNGLLSMEAAKNNHPDIKKKYFADAFDGIDKFLDTQLEDETFTPEDVAEIKGEKSTTKKIELMKTKLKAAQKKADPADKAAINKTLADLNESLRISKEDKANTVKQYEEKIKDIHKKSHLTALFSNYKTIYDELPGSIKNTSLEAMITQALQDNDAELQVGENGTLNLVRKDGSNVFGSDNRQLTPQSFLDRTFAPILKQSTPAKPANGVTITPAIPATNGFANQDLKSHAEKVIAEMAANTVG